MTTLTQEKYAHKLVTLLNENGFTASFIDNDEYAPVITYSKDGVFGVDIMVSDLIRIDWANSIEIKEKADSLQSDLATCESEIKRAIENGAVDMRGKTEEEILNSFYS